MNKEIAPKPSHEVIEGILRSRGFKVRSNVSLKGRSGTKHHVDAFAVKREGDSERQFLLGLALSDSPVGIQEVYRVWY